MSEARELREAGATFERVFESIIAPLVLGGTITPEKPIGARRAVKLTEWTASPQNADLLSRVQLVRVRRARSLSPIGHMDPPSGTEVAMGAVLHDILQATHPGFLSLFRKNTPRRILSLAESALQKIPPPARLSEALLRHTLFARMFSIERKDVVVRWWTGSATFLGEEPSARLLAWPEVRRVHQQITERGLDALPETGSIDRDLYERVLRAFLSRTPLTDWASCDRSYPAFQFTSENVALITSIAGRSIVLRSLARKGPQAIDAALGRATRTLLEKKAWQAVSHMTDLLAERALGNAEVQAIGRNAPPLDMSDKDAAFARCAGALAAKKWLSGHATFRPTELRAILAILDAEAHSQAAAEVHRAFSAT